MVLDIGRNGGVKPKCFFQNSQLPTFTNHDQPPTKKRPFSTILDQPFSHRLNVILPTHHVNDFKKSLSSEKKGMLQYATVCMKLGEVIEGDFFNVYIKSGNIIMLSEGRPGTDQVYSLRDGLLRLELDRSTFERTGFEGKPIMNPGRKHVKARFEVVINLRLPSMVRGRKGFDRMVWAFNNVLSASVIWLFRDLKAPLDSSRPISKHHPLVRLVEPELEDRTAVQVPSFASNFEKHDFEDAAEILEWLGFAMNAIPRIQKSDVVDDYVCRYSVPQKQSPGSDDTKHVQDLTCLIWHGFITADFVTRTLLSLLKHTDESWFGLSATAFDGQAYTALKFEDRTMTWQYSH